MSSPETLLVCQPVSLPPHLWLSAAATAKAENPANGPDRLGALQIEGVLAPEHIALITSRYWGAGGVKLSVQFLDTQDTALKNRILSHMNAWGESANVVFAETRQQGQVRIARTPRSGYWSFLGTDILSIPAGQPTMNLDSFALSTPESEYRRVVRHEAGHTCGFPHEHLRKELVARIDVQKAIAYFARYDGWDEATVRAQVLTPLDERDLALGPLDQQSIMCYALPASVTIDGQPILGGTDIDPQDAVFAAKIYPKASPPPLPPTAGGVTLTLSGALAPGTYTLKPS